MKKVTVYDLLRNSVHAELIPVFILSGFYERTIPISNRSALIAGIVVTQGLWENTQDLPLKIIVNIYHETSDVSEEEHLSIMQGLHFNRIFFLEQSYLSPILIQRMGNENTSSMKTLEERISILDEEVLRLTEKGWIVKNRTDTTCILIKEDSAMGCLSLILSFLVLFPFFDQRIKTRMIEVSPEGIIKRSRPSF